MIKSPHSSCCFSDGLARSSISTPLVFLPTEWFLKLMFVTAFLLYTPLQVYSSAVNYILATVSFVAFMYTLKHEYKLPKYILLYFFALMALFVINYVFAPEKNTNWFLNHLAFVFALCIYVYLYVNASNCVIVRLHRLIGILNNLLCMFIGFSIPLFVILHNGLELISDGRYNELIWTLTEGINWPKSHLSIITSYTLIWVAMTKRRFWLLAYLIMVVPIILAGRSSTISLVVISFLYLFNKFKNKFLAFLGVVSTTIFIALFCYIIYDLDTRSLLYYDRLANFMVSIDLANDNIFGIGNGAYHWYVEMNQIELNSKYSYLFSNDQVEVFLGPESMFNHIIGSFGYLLAFVFYYLQALTFVWSYKFYDALAVLERSIIIFWVATFIAGVGQTSIMIGFPYFIVWAMVIAICLRSKRMIRNSLQSKTISSTGSLKSCA